MRCRLSGIGLALGLLATASFLLVMTVAPAAGAACEQAAYHLASGKTLTKDLCGSIRFDNDHITLDCAGHTISYGSKSEKNCGAQKCAIAVSGRHAVTIKNCKISGNGTNNFYHGIWASNSQLDVSAVTISDPTSAGVYVTGDVMPYVTHVEDVSVDVGAGKWAFRFNATSRLFGYNLRDISDSGAHTGGILVQGSSGIVIKNTILNREEIAHVAGSQILIEESQGIRLTSTNKDSRLSQVYYSSLAGIDVKGSDDVRIEGVDVEHGEAGGVRFENSTGIVDSCYIANNDFADVLVDDDSDVQFINTSLPYHQPCGKDDLCTCYCLQQADQCLPP